LGRNQTKCCKNFNNFLKFNNPPFSNSTQQFHSPFSIRNWLTYKIQRKALQDVRRKFLPLHTIQFYRISFHYYTRKSHEQKIISNYLLAEILSPVICALCFLRTKNTYQKWDGKSQRQTRPSEMKIYYFSYIP
jgi:hypothetical protein